MADRFVAADANPLIGLATAGAFHLLKDLFGRVTVTPAVRDEVLAGGSLPGATELTEAIASGWIEVAEIAETHGDVPAVADLDTGEASTLALAVESPDEWLVLIDEPLGRAQARASGIAVTGLVGVLLAAKRAGFLPGIRLLLERPEASNFRLSTEVIRAALEQAGEA